MTPIKNKYIVIPLKSDRKVSVIGSSNEAQFAKVVAIPDSDKDIKVGDVILINYDSVIEYEFNDKKFFVVSKEDVIASMKNKKDYDLLNQ